MEVPMAGVEATLVARVAATTVDGRRRSDLPLLPVPAQYSSMLGGA